jgi:ribosomal-protein-alanine N-acetyltransferase
MALAAFPVLRSARLRLREIVPRDTNAWLALQSNPDVMRWYGAEVVQSQAQIEKIIADCALWRVNGVGIRWGIEHDGEFIGSCGFARWNKGWHNATLGYEIAPHCQGKGLMREALNTIFAYGFNEMQLHRIHAEIHRDNLASIKLVQRLGFSFEGVHREMGFWAGRWHDLDFYSLLEQEWQDAMPCRIEEK